MPDPLLGQSEILKLATELVQLRRVLAECRTPCADALIVRIDKVLCP